jgi:hypothetical protein
MMMGARHKFGTRLKLFLKGCIIKFNFMGFKNIFS